MPVKLTDVCRYIRSKNAGPFWVTVDIFFKDRACFDLYSEAGSLQIETIARMFDVDAAKMKRFLIRELNVLKFSFPRHHPQGGAVERDMHGGQQYVRLEGVKL